jgi:hypothetical protein
MNPGGAVGPAGPGVVSARPAQPFTGGPARRPFAVVTRVLCLGCGRIYSSTVSAAMALAVGRSDCCGSPTEVLDAEPEPS